MKKKVLVTSFLTMGLCLSLIAGSSFALFTSKSNVNIAVTSGKVDVVATIADLEYASNSASREYDGKWIEATKTDGVWSGTFENNGVVTYDGTTNKFNLNGITPGDAVRFNITITNNSTVAVKYQTAVSRDKDSHAGLFNALEIEFGGQEFIASGFSGANKYSVWNTMTLEDEKVITVPVTIELPYDVQDTIVNGVVTEESIQGKSCGLEFVVSAVQGNASTTDPEENPDYVAIHTVEDLEFFRGKVNSGDKFEGKTVKLMSDIDLEDQPWSPIGGVIDGTTYSFNGKFDGNGFTIKRLNVCAGDASKWGLFGRMYGTKGYASISNLKVNGVKIGDSEYGTDNRQGALLGSGQFVKIDNVQVTNLDITSDSEARYLGGLVGHGVAVDVNNCFVQGNIATNVAAQVGGVLGYCGPGKITNCRLDLKVNGLYMSSFGGIVANFTYDGETYIKNCYINLEMTNAGKPMWVGGIVGAATNSSFATKRITVQNCYVTGSFDGYYNDVNAGDGVYGDESVRSGLGGLCCRGYGIDFDNCFVNMDVPGGKYLVANCNGDYGTAEVWNVTNCSWKGGADSYTYYGWQQEPSHEYGTIAKAECIFGADMTYADFLNVLNNL